MLGTLLQICAYGASDQAAFAALFKLIRYPISPEIAQCWLEVMCKLCERRAPAFRSMPSAGRGIRHMETGGGAEMPIVPNAPILAAGAHDQAHEGAGGRALRLGASR